MRIFYLFFLPCCLLLAAPAPAQATYGELIYTRTESLAPPETGEEAMSERLEGLLQELHASGGLTQRYRLRFTPGAFEFRELEQEAREIEKGGITIMVHSGSTPPDHFYTDTRDNRLHNSEAIADRMFQYAGPVPAVEWTLVDEEVAATAATLGFQLRTAQGITAGGDTLLARYAPALPAAFGPLNYYGLPGAILQLRIGGPGNAQWYRATALELHTEPVSVAPARVGKEVSPGEFTRQRARYHGRRGGSGSTVVRMR